MNILSILPEGMAEGWGGGGAREKTSRALSEARERKGHGDLIGYLSIDRKGLKLLPLFL